MLSFFFLILLRFIFWFVSFLFSQISGFFPRFFCLDFYDVHLANNLEISAVLLACLYSYEIFLELIKLVEYSLLIHREKCVTRQHDIASCIIIKRFIISILVHLLEDLLEFVRG